MENHDEELKKKYESHCCKRFDKYTVGIIFLVIYLATFVVADTVYYYQTFKPCKMSGAPCEREFIITIFLMSMWLGLPIVVLLGYAFYVIFIGC